MSISPIVLQKSGVSPASGSTSTLFRFSTVYYETDAATHVAVIVSGVVNAIPMTKLSGTPASGVTYTASKKLPAGSHTFNFYATDGTSQWNNPKEPGVFSGLKVRRRGKRLSIPQSWDRRRRHGSTPTTRDESARPADRLVPWVTVAQIVHRSGLPGHHVNDPFGFTGQPRLT